MKILLINVPYIFELYKESTIPLGIAYIASNLRQSHTVKILDMNIEKVTRTDFIKLLCDFKPDLAGFSVKTPTQPLCNELAHLIKETNPDIKIVFGGPQPTACPEELTQDVDYAVIGEGEKTILELADTIEKNKNPMHVSGISFKSHNRIIITKPREAISTLDEIPFPSFDLFPTEKYTGCGFRNGFYMITSRGCPYSCTYCSAHLTFGKKVRRRSIKNVIQELSGLIEKYYIKWIVFDDDVFTLDRNYCANLCKEIISQKMDITWWCNTRVDRVDEKLLEIMHKAGCEQISYGIESGSERILSMIKKGTNVQQAYEAVKSTRKAGIVPSGYFMVNFPSEKMDEIQSTIDLAKTIGVTYFRISMAIPYPKTDMWEQCSNDKILPTSLENYAYLNNIIIHNPEVDAAKLRKKIVAANVRMFLRSVWFSDSARIWLKSLMKTKNLHIPLFNVLSYYKNLRSFNSHEYLFK